MLSKREKLYQAAEGMNALRCPVCGGDLNRSGDDFACGAKHRVNVNRKGCLNFLSTPVDSCYDAALFQARRRVFAAGCYRAVADALEEMLPQGVHRLLDAGCGDGWYLNALLMKHDDWQGAGVDISRDAILQATDQPCTALWCVGDLRKLPFRDGAFTAILDVLTPANYDEFRRVLAPEGMLLKVYPGSGYLWEIRAARGMEPYAEGQVEAYLREKATILAERRVTVSHPVTPELWRDFVWMTPLNQDLSDEAKEQLARRPAEMVTIDLHIAAVRM
ncbi:MAG: methyltransferase domain-containing protein [Clostridiales bacterium]|nr:methyltransferase domain-containing protein [Clostridiales bacterium]